jgi:hypothetical protein
VQAKRNLEVTFHAPGSAKECEGMNPHTPKGILTLGVGIPMDSRIFKERLQGSKIIGFRNSLYHWKAFDEGYNFSSDLILIRDMKRKLWAPKVAGASSLGISGLPLGNPGTKCHLDVGLMERHRVYYKGEGGGFPQVWAAMSLVSSSLPVARPNTKSVQTMH